MGVSENKIKRRGESVAPLLIFCLFDSIRKVRRLLNYRGVC